MDVSLAAGSHGRTWVMSSCSLAPSAFLDTAATTLPLQDEILSDSSHVGIEDTDVSNARAI